MTAECYPLRVLLIAFSGWVHREQQRTIEYLVEENRVLKEQLKGRKLRLNDDQRRRLAAERAPRRPTLGTEIRCEERLGGLLRHYSYAA
jgi:hypothetical protein